MRVTLGLTDKELMDTPWISLIMATNDFPWYDYNGKKVINNPGTEDIILGKFTKP
jgi:hypothetical protein